MKQKNRKIIYYTDEINDEFSKTQITPRVIDKSYNYEGGALRKAGRIFLYHILAKPIAFVFLKLRFSHKIVNKKCLEKAKNTGFFLYGNHTNDIADALIPTIVAHPKSVYVIVHANNVSMPFLGKLTPSLGAVPLPDDKAASNNFNKVINNIINKGKCVTIYPEAHIWPYCTWIRNYPDASFRYPVKYKVPVYCFTNTYHKKRFGKIPKIVTYVDGPFYPKEELSVREQRKDLHKNVIETMKKRSGNNTVCLVEYVKKEG